ncbi:MAG: EAL domain-containing protein [Oceanospirillaceae bacterium]|nr:EAL domain-containing protein [Oceanospirillaceae bacterium]
MTLHSQAKLLLRYQSLGIISIVLFIIVGVFSYFLLKDNSNYQRKLETLDREIRQQHQAQIKLEVKSARDYILYMNSRAEQQLREQSRTAVEQAHNIAVSIYQQQKDNFSQEQIKALIIASLRNIRFFKGRGYYYIFRLDSFTLLLPTATELEGTYLLDNPEGATPIRNVLDSVDNPEKSGYASYRWYNPLQPKKLSEKISYSKVFKPFNWVIGTGDYVSSFEDDLRTAALERLTTLKSQSQANITVLDTHAKIISHLDSPDNPLQQAQRLRPELFAEILNFAKKGGGFTNFSDLVNYQSAAMQVDRLAYIETISPFGWVLIADMSSSRINAFIEKQRKQMNLQSQSDLIMLFVVLAITGLLTLAMLYLYTYWFKRIFRNYQRSIDLQQRELSLNTQELKLAARVFDSSNDAIMVTDANYKIIAANPASHRVTGYSNQEVLGQYPLFFASDPQDHLFYKQMAAIIKENGHWQGEVFQKHKSGKRYPIRLSISTCLGKDRKIMNYISVFSDITERKKTERQLIYLADFDPLTKLAKRHLIAQRVDEVICNSKRTGNQKFALMLVDLDRFKNINDSLGHNVGDQVLQQVAQRLSANIRASDIISRLSGDEFIILVNHHKAESAATRLANRVLRDLAEPIKIGSHDLVVTPSIGIAIYPANGENFDALLKNADAALHHAKSQGRNNFQYFTIDMHQRASEKLTLERGLRQALHNQQFELHYQAQYDLNSGRLVGCEALLRWHCPELNNPSPDKFIPVAEDTGLILPIGQWVLEQACLQAALWQSQGYEPIPIAVNVSSFQFNKNIVASVDRCLQKAKLDAKWLVVEITESALMHDPELTEQILIKLRQLGVKIALDDFGTGYSSLAYLKRFPIDKLKIDKTFINGLPGDKDDLVITRSIIDVARNLNMTIIAEGVETTAQELLLKSLGCHQMQGFLKAKPVAQSQFIIDHFQPLTEKEPRPASPVIG